MLIYNLQKEDSLIATSSKVANLNLEKITHIRWIKNYDSTSSSPYVLVTTGIDGRMIIWHINIETNDFYIQTGFVYIDTY